MKGVIDSPDSIAMQQDNFGCVVTNRFDQLLDDEADPFDILREAEVERQKKKKKEEVKKGNAGKSGKKESQKERKIPVFEKVDDGQIRSLAGRIRLPRDGQVQNENRRPVEAEGGERRVAFRERRLNEMVPPQEFSDDRPLGQPERGGWGRGGSRGRGGGYNRNVDGFDPRGKREYDRYSASDRFGVRPDEKRGGNGPRNWGSVRDTMSDGADACPAEKGAEEARDPTEVNLENRASETDGEAAQETVVEMSLDEWKALQDQNRPKKDFNLRKPDTKVPSKALVIHKSKLSEALKEGVMEEDEDGHFFRRPANDITSTLDINFGSLARPSRGRGRGRGGRERQGGPGTRVDSTPARSEMAQALAPNPDDPEDFPALA